MEPDEKLLKKVAAINKAILDKSLYKEEPVVYKDNKAISSDERIKKLNK